MSTPTTLIAHRYRLVKMLGAGGMGVVWQAWDERLHRPVALKMLRAQPEVDDSERALSTERAMREARITAGLHHPHAVTVFDVIEHEGRPCIVMQLIESTPLSVLLKEHGPMTPSQTARVGAQVASALAAAHGLRIVHRDVKPGNILITADGSALISDFGISHALGDATITATGLIHGTPAYLAPEAAKGLPTSFASDVFSLGSTMYTMLEGSPPFGTDGNAISLLHKVARGGYDPPKNAGALTPLLKQMLATNPKRRPTMAAVAASLSALASGAGQPAVFPDGVAVLTAMLDGHGPDAADRDAATEALSEQPPLPTTVAAAAGAAAAAAAAGAAAAGAPGAFAEPPTPASDPDAVTEPADEPVAEPLDEPVAEPMTPASDPDAVTEPADEPVAEPLDEPVAEPLPDAATEPVTEPVAEPLDEPPAEPTVAPSEPTPGPDTETARTVPADQPSRFEPPTAATARLAAAAGASPTAETVPVRPTPAPGATQPAPAPESPAEPPDRRRRIGLVAGILTLVGALVLGAAMLFQPWRTPVDEAGPSTQSPAPAATQPTPTPDPDPEPTQTPEPELTPTTEPQPQPATPEQKVVETISGYYAMLPADLDAAWPLMTADYQENHAGGRGGYEAFWSNVASLEVADVTASGPDSGQATLTYHFDDGRVVQEVTSYRLVDEGGVLKIAETDVLSSVQL